MATLIKQQLSSAWSGVRLVHLNEQCAAFLSELGKIPALQTAFVCDNHGKVLAAWSAGNFDAASCNAVGASIAQTFAAFQTRSSCKDLELRFEQRTLLARDLGNAFAVVSVPTNATLSMVRMTLNVSASIIESDAELQASLKQVAPTRAGSLSSNNMNAALWQLAHQANLVKVGGV